MIVAAAAASACVEWLLKATGAAGHFVVEGGFGIPFRSGSEHFLLRIAMIMDIPISRSTTPQVADRRRAR